MPQPDGKHGRVLQVNVSAGGVPKRPVAEAWVDRLGLAGDAHHDELLLPWPSQLVEAAGG